MIFLPFPDEAYRFRKRNIFSCMTVVSVLFSALYSAVLCLRDIERYPSHVQISNSFMLAAMLLILAAYVWLVRESLIKKVLVFFIVLFYAVTEFVLVNMLLESFEPGMITVAYAYSRGIVLLYAGVSAILLPLMLLCVMRPLRAYVREIEPQNMRREFVVMIIFTLLYFCMTIYCYTFYETYRSIGDTAWKMQQTQHLLILLMMVNQGLIYSMIFRDSVRRKRDSDRRRVMELQQLQYDAIVGDMENTRRMRHDMRHHYNSLNDMLNRGQTEEMKTYLSRLIDITVQRDSEIYCQNMMVNGLLQYYIGMARDEGIRCRVYAECGELAIEPEDLTVLFGNAMENAIHACRKCEDRWIDVRLGTVQGSLAIEISNSCREARLNRHFQTEDGFSPAEAFISGRRDEVYGLRSISRTAQKYDGSAKFRFNAEQGIFTARIRLNLQRDLETARL